ncbi:MAG: hypothetical protein BAJALOKI2v1_740022 [Promethearchaeota archaeon]|nr:MAG: hypothetical protein BAJALOKI2v1_740022 [Candidatus Lokiarchaeota archaeon]
MEKGKIIGIVAILAIIIIVGAVVGVVLLVDPCANEEAVLKISGDGVKEETDLSLCNLQQNKYDHVENKEFDWRNNANFTGADQFTGVVIWDLLKGLVNDDAENLEAEVIASDGYSRSLDLSLFESGAEDVILAYGGEDFDSEEDGNLRLVIDLSLYDEGEANTKYWVSNIVEINISVK